MYPSVIVCVDKYEYRAYPCSVDGFPAVPSEVSEMIGFGKDPNEALLNLDISIKSFVDLNGISNADIFLDSVYGKNNHVNLVIDSHPMMKHFIKFI